MLNLFSRFRTDKIWDFKGGIHPPEMKTQSNGTPLAGLENGLYMAFLSQAEKQALRDKVAG